MSARDRRAKLNSDFLDEDGDTPTLQQADAALFGALRNVDKNRGVAKRTEFGAFRITAKGLEVSGEPNQNDWRELGKYLFFVEAAIQWLIGDWLVYGEGVSWGDATILAEEFGRNPHTFHNYMSVCRAINISRRRDDLSFAHHETVARLSDEQQEFALAYAAENKLSVANFRRWLRGEDERPALTDGRTSIDKTLRFMQRVRAVAQRRPDSEKRQIASSLRALADELDPQ